ncbi:hypothetical protein B0H11DRAFT_2266546 [Mycena galericulata]|nr:hypothetical protein B0H11DRAFT_2266546 [Mycena galericulata]
MANNACQFAAIHLILFSSLTHEYLGRDIVRYIPVWKPEWEDEVPPLISEEESLWNLIASLASVNYDDPIIWIPGAAFSIAGADSYSPKFWYQPREQERHFDLQRGEFFVAMDFAFQWLTCPIIAIDYSYGCRNRCHCDCHKKLKAKL